MKDPMTPNIQIRHDGLHVSGSKKELRKCPSRFDRDHCIRLPQLLESSLLKSIQHQIAKSEFVKDVHENISVESTMKDNLTLYLLRMMLNVPEMINTVKELTGCRQIQSFNGRIYRLDAREGHYDNWHSDELGSRIIVMSLNLSEGIYSGGVLQIRKQGSEKILYEIANTGFGDAILFRISEDLEHRLTDLKGSIHKTAFAGWFLSVPCVHHYTLKKQELLEE